MRTARFVQCSGIFLVAAVVRVSLAILLEAFQREPSGEMFAVAHSIANEGVFGNPNFVASGPTAFVAPVYPYILAGLLKLAPDQFALAPLLTTLNILVASLLWALLPGIAEGLALPRRVGLLAGILGAVNPIRHWVELTGYWDATLSGFLMACMAALTLSRRSTWTKPSRALIVGVGWGFLALLQPATVTVFAFFFSCSRAVLPHGRPRFEARFSPSRPSS